MVQAEVLDDVAAGISVTRRIQPTFGYYRQPNGWITLSPITRMERVKYIERGWEHLGQYGAFDMTTYVANHPLEALFMFGGAKELPVEQIIQMGLYIDPPLVPRCQQHITQFHRAHNVFCWRGAQPVVFPQLEGVHIEPFPCAFCNRRLPTVEAKEQHQSVAHKDRMGNLQTGKSLGESLAEALGRSAASGVSAEVQEMRHTIEALRAQVEQQGKAAKPRSRSRKKV